MERKKNFGAKKNFSVFSTACVELCAKSGTRRRTEGREGGLCEWNSEACGRKMSTQGGDRTGLLISSNLNMNTA